MLLHCAIYSTSFVVIGYLKLKTLDIISSAYNEEECLPEFFFRIHKVMSAEPTYNYRILMMDNASSDSSWSIISKAAIDNDCVVGYRMSRNFSLDAAFTNGLDKATADCAIIMASDLQDSPEAIPKLLRKYEEGFDHVLVRVTSRESVPIMRRILTKIFYYIANRLTSGMLPESVSDFRLLSKPTYQAIRQLRESHRFIRGLGAWVGFKTAEIELLREPRFGGSSKWLKTPLSQVIANSSRSILAHSSKPLTWISIFGLFLSITSIFLIIVLSFFWIFYGVPFAGFGSLVGLAFLGFSFFMLCIGIMAQYLGLSYEEVKQRPLYIVAETTNT